MPQVEKAASTAGEGTQAVNPNPLNLEKPELTLDDLAVSTRPATILDPPDLDGSELPTPSLSERREEGTAGASCRAPQTGGGLEEGRLIDSLNAPAASIKAGATYYLVSSRWWREWKAHTRSGARPGPIANAHLLAEQSKIDGTAGLRRGLMERADYQILCADAWEQLARWYGGGPVLARTAFADSGRASLDLYGVSMKVKRSGDSQELLMCNAAKWASIEQLRLALCWRLHLDPDATRLWDFYGGRRYALLDEPHKTLQQVNITDNQEMMLEEQDDDGTYQWPDSPDEGGTTSGSSAEFGVDVVMSSTPPEYPGLVGLTNLGNTCFMNSVLQCIQNSKPLRDLFVSEKYKDDLNADNPLGHGGKLAEAFGSLMKVMYSGEGNKVAPRGFKKVLGEFNNQFVGFQQHDSQELLNCLLDGLHEDLNRVKQKPYTEAVEAKGRSDETVAKEALEVYKQRNDSHIVDLCTGLFKSIVVCPDCTHVSKTFDPYFSISLPLAKATALEQIIDVQVFDFAGKHKAFSLTVGREGSVLELRAATAAASGVPLDRLVLVETFSNNVHKIFEDTEDLKDIRKGDVIVCFEVDDRSPYEEVVPIEWQSHPPPEEWAIDWEQLEAIETATDPAAAHDAEEDDPAASAGDEDPSGASSEPPTQAAAPLTDPPAEDQAEVDAALAADSALAASVIAEGAAAAAESGQKEEHDLAWAAGDVWSGSYRSGILAQNARFTVLAVTEATDRQPARVRAVFDFENHRGTQGSFLVTGDFDRQTGEIKLIPRGWVKELRAMTMVPFTIQNPVSVPASASRTGNATGNSMWVCWGSVLHASCGPIVLERQRAGGTSAPLEAPVAQLPTASSRGGNRPALTTAPLPDLVNLEGTAAEECDPEEQDEESPANEYQPTSVAVICTHKRIECKRYPGYTQVSRLKQKFGVPIVLSVSVDATEGEVHRQVMQALQRHGADTGLAFKILRATKHGEEDPRYQPPGSRVGEEVRDDEEHKDLPFRSRREVLSSDPMRLVLAWGEVAADRVFPNGAVTAAAITDGEEEQEKMMQLKDCLNLFAVQEQLPSTDQWFCPKCRDFKCAFKKMDLWSVPPLMALHFKRFSVDAGSFWMDKVETPVKFPAKQIDMAPFVLCPDAVTSYSLVAVSNHFGGLGGGHYTACARNEGSGEWYEFDDSCVSHIDDPEVKLDYAAAYVLFYLRDDLCPAAWRDKDLGEPNPTEVAMPPPAHETGSEPPLVPGPEKDKSA